MTGIFLIIVIILWFYIVKYFTRNIVKTIQPTGIQKTVRIILFIVLMVAPITDEIIAGFHFRSLCKEKAVVNIDIDKAKGKVLSPHIIGNPNRHKTIESLVPISETSYDYYDPETREIVLSYKTLSAKGGWFIRSLGTSNSSKPLLFTSFCAPADRFSVFVKYKIKKVDDYKAR